ncbi:LysE family translocator [Exilibacterium tricleocarpae]|uniref:LysE family translocator n=1 Tax=Exilibacterium tricleocarpae TaxID=2591008 RepID=A0A545TZN7_9GAMM|nr:LysE family translocator [Exilibacterium tricleocarpae]TQV82682.1 LysE family translocator [Exilibacterium tricleocarpae]
MIDPNTAFIFITASVLLALAPGPDNIFVLTQSMLQGAAAGLLVTLGLCTGLLVHTTAVAFGVAVIFQTSAFAFTLLKLMGAAYLLYLSWQAFRAGKNAGGNGDKPHLTGRSLYRRGIIMNITNPKVSIFFLAFLPQFADPGAGSLSGQLIVLGLLFIASALLVFGCISLLAGRLGRWFKQSEHAEKVLNRIAGTVFAGLALKLALTER